jgi:hypothetical protein
VTQQEHEAWVVEWCARMQRCIYGWDAMREQWETLLEEMQGLYTEAQRHVERQLADLNAGAKDT